MALCSVYLDHNISLDIFGYDKAVSTLTAYCNIITSGQMLAESYGKWDSKVYTIEVANILEAEEIAEKIIQYVRNKNETRATRVPLRGCVCTNAGMVIPYSIMMQTFRLFSNSEEIYKIIRQFEPTPSNVISRPIKYDSTKVMGGFVTSPAKYDEVIYYIVSCNDHAGMITHIIAKEESSRHTITVTSKYPINLSNFIIDQCSKKKSSSLSYDNTALYPVIIHSTLINYHSEYSLFDTNISRYVSSVYLIAQHNKIPLVVSDDLTNQITSVVNKYPDIGVIRETYLHDQMMSSVSRHERVKFDISTVQSREIKQYTARDVEWVNFFTELKESLSDNVKQTVKQQIKKEIRGGRVDYKAHELRNESNGEKKVDEEVNNKADNKINERMERETVISIQLPRLFDSKEIFTSPFDNKST